MSANKLDSKSEESEIDEDIFNLENDQPMIKEAVVS